MLLANTRGPRIVLHFGAISSTAERRSARLRELNVEATEVWAMECAAAGVPLVFASSFGVYGNGPKAEVGKHCLTEYARSKWDAERKICRRYALGSTILRLTNVYGPGEETKPGQSFCYETARKLSAGETVEIYEPDPARDWVPVSSVVKVVRGIVLRCAGGARHPNRIFEIGSGVPRTFREMAYMIGDAIGIPPARQRELIRSVPLPDGMVGRYQLGTCAAPPDASFEKQIGAYQDGRANHHLREWLRPIFGPPSCCDV